MPTTTTRRAALPIGSRVAILADTHGDDARHGTIVGHVAYVLRYDLATSTPGYAVHLDLGGYLDGDEDNRLYVSVIVCHADSVSPA